MLAYYFLNSNNEDLHRTKKTKGKVIQVINVLYCTKDF